MPRGVPADLIGKRFGRLVVLRESGRNSCGNKTWLCQCDCGNFSRPTTGSLNGNGRSRTESCGCLYRESRKDCNRTHGRAYSRTYSCWASMIQRCRRQKAYEDVSVCDRWKNSFENFLTDMGECPEGLTNDRIDPHGNYEPGNCRWADRKTQGNNKRDTRMFTYKGETKPLAIWCDDLGLSYNTTRMRLDKLGWPVDRAFGVKQNASTRMIEYLGRTQSVADWCRELGLEYQKTLARLNALGWPAQRAFEEP